MIASLPHPFEEELLYSWLARLASDLDFPHQQDLPRELFGHENLRAKVDLPVRLDYLAARLSNFLGSGRAILNKMTLFPLYRPFLRQPIAEKLVASMLDAQGAAAKRISSLTTLRLKVPARLRYCPSCWEECGDEDRYWRRPHQCPGVFMCYHHARPLYECVVLADHRQTFVAAESIKEGQGREIQVPAKGEALLMDIAVGSWWLLAKNRFNPGPELYQEAYVRGLGELELTWRGVVNSAVVDLVREKVGPDMLRRLHSPLVGCEANWLLSMVRRGRAARGGQSPLRHMILMSILGHQVASFHRMMQRPDPIDQLTEEPPAPCSEKKVSPCELHRNEIEQWWNGSELSVAEIAKRVGVAPDTIKLFASRSGFVFPRSSLKGVTRAKLVIKIRQPRRRREECRAAFLLHVAQFPKMTQTEMLKAGLFGVKWLHRHDRTWLLKHRNPSTRKGGAPGLDWDKRDGEFASFLSSMVSGMQKRGGKLSLSAIGQRLGITLANPKVNRRLPKTMSLIFECRSKGLRGMLPKPNRINEPEKPEGC